MAQNCSKNITDDALDNLLRYASCTVSPTTTLAGWRNLKYRRSIHFSWTSFGTHINTNWIRLRIHRTTTFSSSEIIIIIFRKSCVVASYLLAFLCLFCVLIFEDVVEHATALLLGRTTTSPPPFCIIVDNTIRISINSYKNGMHRIWDKNCIPTTTTNKIDNNSKILSMLTINGINNNSNESKSNKLSRRRNTRRNKSN